MIQEAYVSFETAKLLKEKGFDEDIDLWYDEKGDKFFKYHYDIKKDWRVRQNQQVYLCPTQQMAMRWLREVHKIDIVVMPTAVDDTFKTDITIYPVCNGQYEWMCMRGNGTAAIYGYNINKSFCDSYEDAVEAAIKYCLTNLI